MNITLYESSDKNKRLFMINLCDFKTVDGVYGPVYTPCWGFFRKPTSEELRTHSQRPVAIFQPLSDGYNVTFYNTNQIIESITAEMSCV